MVPMSSCHIIPTKKIQLNSHGEGITQCLYIGFRHSLVCKMTKDISDVLQCRYAKAVVRCSIQM